MLLAFFLSQKYSDRLYLQVSVPFPVLYDSTSASYTLEGTVPLYCTVERDK